MTLWTGLEIAQATGGTASAQFTVSGIAFDSREVGPGDLFVALAGSGTDGHRFLSQAFAQGAVGALVSEACDHPHVRVVDTTAALDALARAARARTRATVIGVTGSVGKTSVKEALAAALERSVPGQAHRSVKSYNNHTGVPLSLARMPADSRFAVLEMGMNHAGEIAALTRLVRPHIALITAVAAVHIEHFADEAAIADAKAEIFEGLQPGGTAIVPFDSPHRDRLIASAKAHGAAVVTFGSGDGADVRAMEVMRTPVGGSFVQARFGAGAEGRELSFTLAQPGAHHVANALGVLAAVAAAGADIGLAGLALAEQGGLPGRGARFRTASGASVLDESYNANPTSMRATLAVLAAEPGRHVAILGAMGELGTDAARYHAELAGPVLDARVEAILLVGKAMAPLADALEQKVNVVHVPDAAAAVAALGEVVRAGDVVLIKGSNSVGLSRVVTALKGGA